MATMTTKTNGFEIGNTVEMTTRMGFRIRGTVEKMLKGDDGATIVFVKGRSGKCHSANIENIRHVN